MSSCFSEGEDPQELQQVVSSERNEWCGHVMNAMLFTGVNVGSASKYTKEIFKES